MIRKSVCVGAAIACAAVSLALAGDLNPPAGPVAPTQRTPISANTTPGDADSTFKITQPGSYYLTANLTGEIGKHGIEIAASGVTIDLNGFDLVGVAGMGNFDGIRNTGALAESIAIFNGTIRSWGGDGIDLQTNAVSNCRIEDVLSSRNTGAGISTGVGGTVSDCSAYFNSGVGFSAAGVCVFSRCIANRNGSFGFNAGAGGTIVHCAAYFNSSIGIAVAQGANVLECTAQSNTTDGILCGGNSLVRGNTCSLNGNGGTGAGIRTALNGSRIEDNTCSGADTGIDIDGEANIIIRNTCRGNSTNWTIAANNFVGPIIDRTAVGTAAISGNSSASTLGSTDANANFSH